jgi:hypothetical protein
MKLHHYRGAIIRRFSKPSSPFRWESFVAGHGFLYADTLAGMRELIRESV